MRLLQFITRLGRTAARPQQPATPLNGFANLGAPDGSALCTTTRLRTCSEYPDDY